MRHDHALVVGKHVQRNGGMAGRGGWLRAQVIVRANLRALSSRASHLSHHSFSCSQLPPYALASLATPCGRVTQTRLLILHYNHPSTTAMITSD
jgi:hypothetical protein